jgi:hypothetical protein
MKLKVDCKREDEIKEVEIALRGAGTLPFEIDVNRVKFIRGGGSAEGFGNYLIERSEAFVSYYTPTALNVEYRGFKVFFKAVGLSLIFDRVEVD